MSDVTKMADVATIHSLPPEILTTIFTHLPLTDRKNVRQVSSKWYDCCTCSPVTRNEKFTFRTGSISIEDAVRVMLKPNFSIMNLEFQGLLRDNLPTNVWKICGSRIHTLKFYNCQFNDETIKNIITHCVNLRSFIISMDNETFEHSDFNLDNIAHWPGLLDELVQQGIEHTALHTFNIYINDMLLPENILRKIFLIYPNLKHVNTGSIIWHYDEEQIPRPDQCLKVNCESLESFTFNIPTDGFWMNQLVAETDLKLSLKHFEVTLYYDDDFSLKETLLKFFSSQKNLNVVNLAFWRKNYNESVFHEPILYEIIIYILKNCSYLEELYLDFQPFFSHIDWTSRSEFNTLISKLKILSFKFHSVINNKFFREISISPPTKNLTLTTLKLEKYRVNEESCTAFLEHCPELKHLELSFKCTNRILQAIFKALLKLETLILNRIDKCSDVGFTGHGLSQGYSINRLQHLKYLSIYGKRRTNLSDKFLLEIQLPNLETFELFYSDLYKKISVQTLHVLAHRIPQLKKVGINLIEDDGVSEKALIFCLHFKELNYLISGSDTPIKNIYYKFPNLFKNIFKVCTNLKIISDNINIIQLNSFSNEIVCNKFV